MAYNYNSSRLSTFSSASGAGPRPGNQPSAQVSTQTLLNALHTSFTSWQWHLLESSTSLVVNTWKTANEPSPTDGRIGGTVDQDLARKAWEHARRRAEDGCVVLCSLHDSTPSMMAPFASALPIHAPESFYTALNVIKAFTHCVTPFNPSYPRYSSLAATFSLSMVGGDAIGASLALSKSGIDTKRGLLRVPSEPGYRAFDVFYYLNVSSASEGERNFLGLKPYSRYDLLKKSGTFSPPKYMPTADDEAAAEAFRDDLKAIGIKGVLQRNLISALTGLLKLGDTLDDWASDDTVDMIYDDVAALLDTQKASLEKAVRATDRQVFIAGMYEALVDWVIARANETIRRDFREFKNRDSDIDESGIIGDEVDEDSVNITLVSIPGQELGKAAALRTVFDDTDGINAEMKGDGVPVHPAGASVLKEMRDAVMSCEPDLGVMNGAAGREIEIQRDHREGVLESFAQECQVDSYMKEVLHPQANQGVALGTFGRFDLANTLASSRVWFHLCLHPTDDSPATLDRSANHWSAGAVSTQIRNWRLPEWANRRNRHLDYTVDFDFEEFVTRYAQLGCKEGRDGISSWLVERGWCNGEVVVGNERVWVREASWWEAECMIDKLAETREDTPDHSFGTQTPLETPYPMQSPGMGSGFFGAGGGDDATIGGSRDNLLQRQQSTNTLGMKSALGRQSVAPTSQTRNISGGDYGLGTKGDVYKGISYEGGLDPELADGKVVVERKQSPGRRIWVIFVWLLTWWIPSPLLRYVGRMKRPDVRQAWREKVVLVFLILIINATVVFYIIEFGRLLCPNFDKAWNTKEVSYHQGDNDFWVSHAGFVYDLSKFWRTQHSDTAIETTTQNMQPFAGTDVTEYIRPPLNLACSDLVSNQALELQANTTQTYPDALHTSGPYFQTDTQTALHSQTWYTSTFLPKMRTFYKGDLVWTKSTVQSQGQNQQRMWFIYENGIYDLTDYFHTQSVYQGDTSYKFFPSDFETMVTENPGLDITSNINSWSNSTGKSATLQCLNNYFYIGLLDFRDEPRCQVNNYILLAFTIILCTVILVKFLAALQLGSKRRPAPQDKFVICQVPAYTEGEDQLRKSLDSLTSLAYDNKRKLICVICDGMIVGAGNDRPTPKIVLDILGVDPKIDPPALPFKAVGQGSEQLNYGKVYSGLYEFEGNVVPYIVVVKVGKESEYNLPKPGNRGKRDSQILLMSFLNRVHHRAAMSPLELEMFHQINNIIGVDPELYEYMLMVDADTMVKEDSLNRLVAVCANDSKVAGICGETALENEERSWWTMIQVYEYYISHHLAKAFESLFGSVTCLPGCFCMYRLRTADKGKPLIIDQKVIHDYSDGDVDTLHKKNLLQLGEDRYLTTLMTKHFPNMSYKFDAASHAYTAAPSEFSVLLSQRRRWINSTIHNLAELVWLKDMCGFCCFSMRFVVFIDLCGTIILPATCAYLGYLIYRAASHSGQFPIISIIMLAAVYGLQAIIFIIKRQWQHVGWMIIYIIAFPVYSFLLPLYSFWRQDDFSWGNTRVVVGESGHKKVIAMEDEGFDPRSIPLQRWDDYAAANNLPGRRGLAHEKDPYEDVPGYELDDMRSEYSTSKPASTVFTGFPQHTAAGVYMPPAATPATPGVVNPYAHMQRQSTYSNFSAQGGQNERLMSMGGLSDIQVQQSQNPYASHRPSFVPQYSPDHLTQSPPPLSASPGASTPNLLGPSAAGARLSRAHSPLAGAPALSRPVSQVNFMDGPKTGPSDQDIIMAVRECLQNVDLDRVTKKMVAALVEQRLQTQLVGEKKGFLSEVIDTELAAL